MSLKDALLHTPRLVHAAIGRVWGLVFLLVLALLIGVRPDAREAVACLLAGYAVGWFFHFHTSRQPPRVGPELGLVAAGAGTVTLAGAWLAWHWHQPWQSLWLAFGLIGMGFSMGNLPLQAWVAMKAPLSARRDLLLVQALAVAGFGLGALLLTWALRARLGHDSPRGILAVFLLLNVVGVIAIHRAVPELAMRLVFLAVMPFFYRVTVVGAGNMPVAGPLVLVSNHVSFVDPVLIGAYVRRPTRFVMYYKIYNLWYINWVFRGVRTIPIAGSKEDPALMDLAFERVAHELDTGNVVGIFPEGSITPTGDLDTFRPGITRILERNPVPVLPMAVQGLWGSKFSRASKAERKRLGRPFFRPRITLVIGHPVPPEQATPEYLEEQVRQLRGEMC